MRNYNNYFNINFFCVIKNPTQDESFYDELLLLLLNVASKKLKKKCIA